MTTSGIEANFNALYTRLMKINFMKAGRPAFGTRPTEGKVVSLVKKGSPLLPAAFRTGYVEPLLSKMDSIFAQIAPKDPLILETLTACVYQHADNGLRPELNRFLAVISDLYDSFLNKSQRTHLRIELSETLPPLAMFQSLPTNGPFTIPCDLVGGLFGGKIGVVSLPATFADHPFFFGSLSHETGGHDVVHADAGLLDQLRQQVYSLFPGQDESWLGLLWDYWMDEATADAYGVLNMGPTFGCNLAMLLAVFIGQSSKPKPTKPTLRNFSGADESGAMDVHPTDLLRLALVEGVVQASPGLSQSTRDSYVQQLNALADLLGNDATTIDLSGQAAVDNGKTINFDRRWPLHQMQEAARKVGAMIATAKFQALDGHSIQDIETWDDSDENAAVKIAGRLQTGFPVVSAGDDAQLMAALTLALMQHPEKYADYSKMINAALDDSFAKDPVWGPIPHDMMIIKPSRTLKNPEVTVDPLAAEIIDYNPLEEDAAESLALGVATVVRHAITQISWPADLAPKLDTSFHYTGQDAELPQADFVIFTWTEAEANAMSAVMTPGTWAAPVSGLPGWNVYANQWASKFANRSLPGQPAFVDPYIGRFMPILIAGRKVLLFKSNFHLARDNASMPVKDMFQQVIEQTQPRLVITSGTAGGIGSRVLLGDVVIANTALFKLDKNFKNAPFNGTTVTSDYAVPANGQLTSLPPLIGKNVAQIKAAHADYPTVVGAFRRSPAVFTPSNCQSALGEPPVIVTTDKFEYDTTTNKPSYLQGKGAMVEMGDAVLGLAIKEMNSAAKWLAIRNASDPQVPSNASTLSSDVYKKYGYWTSINSTLASWACVIDFPM
jgi:hypothetical protein